VFHNLTSSDIPAQVTTFTLLPLFLILTRTGEGEDSLYFCIPRYDIFISSNAPDFSLNECFF
jgi:hypothetical protein